jgi:hypothetical protein
MTFENNTITNTFPGEEPVEYADTLITGQSLWCMIENAYKEAPVTMVKVIDAAMDDNGSSIEREGLICIACFKNL